MAKLMTLYKKEEYVATKGLLCEGSLKEELTTCGKEFAQGVQTQDGHSVHVVLGALVA